MKKLIIASCALAAIASVAFGGTETYSGKQTAVQPAPCPQWYRDTEWERQSVGNLFIYWEQSIGTIPISESTMPGGRWRHKILLSPVLWYRDRRLCCVPGK
jgi:hypothetical protein